MQPESRSPWPWLSGLAILGVVERVLLARVYGPISFGDTSTYFRLAKVLNESPLAAYDATRVPGYPAFIAVMGLDEANLMTAQLTLGVLTSLLIFLIMWQLSANPPAAFAAGAAYDLIGSQLLFEFNLLSESLTTFLLMVTLAGLLWLKGKTETGAAELIALSVGLTASLTGMVRTLFFILPVVLLPFVMTLKRTWAARLRLAVFFSLAPVLLLGGWILFVYSHYGMLSPSTMGGYHMVQHTGAFFEKLPDEEALIRDTYLRYRDEQIAERGTQTNAIWDAIPELSDKTGLGFFALSSKLQQLSFDLIRDNPLLYLRSVVEGWVAFWKAPVYWKPGEIRAPIADLLRLGASLGRLFSLAANFAFLAIVAGAISWRDFRKRLAPPGFIVVATGLVLLASVVQTLVDHGDNPRFLVPLQMVVIVVVLWSVQSLIANSQAKESNAP